jgi:predicted ester cyclase
MSLQTNKAIVRRFVEEVQNQHNLAVMDELISPNIIDYSGQADPGIEGWKRIFTFLFSAFPDVSLTIHKQLAEGDQVMTYKTLKGTHLGNFMGIPPTGKQVCVDLIDIFTVVNGKLTEHWKVVDDLAMLQQLGAVPMPGTQ